MSRNGAKKVVLYIGSYFLLLSGCLWLVSVFPSGYSVASTFIILICFLVVALWALDMTVPGVNIFSKALVRLPNTYASDQIALTFDDGPVEPFTRDILDILDRYNTKATFFCIGENVRKHPDLAREIVRRGHVLGNHTQSHRVLPLLSKAAIDQEIRLGATSCQETTGERPDLFRCPKGYKSRKVIKVAKELGFQVVGFSYPIFDVENPPPDQLVDRVLSRIQGRDIVLMHDGYRPSKPGNRDSLVKALPKILEGIQSRGLVAVTLSGTSNRL